MSFDKLTHEELLRTADEDLAFELSDEEKKSKKLVLAAFAEANLKFADYLNANPHLAEQYAPVPSDPEVVEASKVTGKVTGKTKPVAGTKIIVKEEPVVDAPWLIKMTRENPLFEVGRYRFTTDHPYVLVEAQDVDKVIAQEGFRQATPNELSEYYG